MRAPLENLRLLSCDVRLTCQACCWHKDYPLEDVIARMVKRGLEGEKVGVREVATFTRISCLRCGAREWETTPAGPKIAGQMGW